MTQKPHHSEHPVFFNSPAQTAMYIQKNVQKNKVTTTLTSECYCDFDQYMAHVKQTVHIRPERHHHYRLGIWPTMVPGLIFQGKDTVVKCL